MSAADDIEFLALANEFMNEDGRYVTVGRLAKGSDSEKPWRGSATEPEFDLEYALKAVALPDMTLGLIGGSGFGRMDKMEELVKESEQVLLVAHPAEATLDTFCSCNVVLDLGKRYRIHARKILMPGNAPIFYALGLIR